MKLFDKIFDWITSLFRKKEPKPITSLKDLPILEKEIVKFDFTHCFVEDLPEKINDNIIYIVGENGFYWMLGFNCPCGCKDIIHLSLLQDTSPKWNFKLNKNDSLSISPSIWRKMGCKSHFFIKNSKVKWSSEY